MKSTSNNKLIFLLFSICTGGVIGAFLWTFLKIMSFGIDCLWLALPEKLNMQGYTLILCLLGGLFIGLYEKKYGAYPEELETVMGKLKKDGKYSYDHIFMMSVAAMLPLLFGGSIGPEAGLTGVIVGLCCWAGDRFKYMGKNLKDLTQIGISATLGIIFMSPLFGFMLPIEEKSDDETVFPKSSKVLTYLAAILGGAGSYWLLTHLFGGGMGLVALSGGEITMAERLWVLPLALAGIVFGFIYFALYKITRKLFGSLQKRNMVVLSAMIGALILGLIGTYFPDVMFSGESQMETLSEAYPSYSPYLLILIGILKLLLTNVCINSGWRGGHFFPVIFAGTSIGLGLGGLVGVSPIFAAAVTTAALMSCIMRKPIATVMLLMLCFPAKSVVWMLAAACLAAYIPLPGIFKEKEKERNRDKVKVKSRKR